MDYLYGPDFTIQLVRLMFAWKSIIALSHNSEQPVYLQIANCIIKEIKSGILKRGFRLPGTRELAGILQVHRQTVVNAYDELSAQGWIVSRQSRGSFVSETLPEIFPKRFAAVVTEQSDNAGFVMNRNTRIREVAKTYRDMTGFHDGPDARLVPIESLMQAYRRVLKRRPAWQYFSYVDPAGKQQLRAELSNDVNQSRCMQTKPENIFITRGSQMGIYLVIKALIERGDKVIVGNTSHYYTDRTFENMGAELLRVCVDEDGYDVEEVEKLCRRKKIRALYVTSHHHYPTTVTLSASRRMKLLSLAEQFGFLILEDDYDFDFQFESSPILPLASADRHNMVIYVGTLSKTIAPALRIGYVCAHETLVRELGKLRQIIDVQGDPMLEQAVAELYALGEIRRHLKKVFKIYRMRRDNMCALLQDRFAGKIDFRKPEGGLAIWAKFHKAFPLQSVSEKMMHSGIVLSNGLIHNATGKMQNCTRMGFGWMNEKEAQKATNVLEEVLHQF